MVGSGPNGLAAAVVLARAGVTVRVYEGAATPGGGARTEELTLPGFRHDSCSAVHPLALASPFFRAFGLAERVSFVTPEISYAHPIAPDRVGLAYRDLARTAAELGRDGPAWRALFGPLLAQVDEVAEFTGSAPLNFPRHPFTAARLGARILEQAGPLGGLRFRDELAPALLAGVGAHAMAPLPSFMAASAAMVLGLHAHARGWPLPIGGSQAITDALVRDLEASGGRVITGSWIEDLSELGSVAITILDTSAGAAARIAAAALPDRYRRKLLRQRHGNGAFKLDIATSAPIPWADSRLAAAGTLHLGGTAAQIAAAAGEIARGRDTGQGLLLVSQPTLFDPSRAPPDRHLVWAYTHVPRGSNVDHTEGLLSRIEEHAPGFRDTVLATAARTTSDLEAYNPNYVGGDIAAGAADFVQLLRRPVASPNPWRTPVRGLYLASAATAPGPGVHGMAGWHAARTALHDILGVAPPPLAG